VPQAQKAVDDAVSPIVEEMMNAITALQENMGQHETTETAKDSTAESSSKTFKDV
jgi:hypothetical protein